MVSFRQPFLPLAAEIPSGEPAFLAPAGAVLKCDERFTTYAWLSDRALFGEVYRRLLPDYFDAMPRDSGVVIGSFIPSPEVVPGLAFPGDIDVLVVPYEGSELVLSRVLAIEIKVIRASFARQGKSPNQFGFSQARGLLAAGFPHVAVGHLIVSDRSPRHAWRKVATTTITDADSGACKPLQATWHDMLPSDLLRRSHGRLKHNCPDPLLGHFSAYLGGPGLWFPEGARAAFNPHTRMDVMEGIYSCYQKHYQHFLLTRRYPCASSVSATKLERTELFRLIAEKMHQDFH